MLTLHLKQRYAYKKSVYNLISFYNNINDLFQNIGFCLLNCFLFFEKKREPNVEVFNLKDFFKIKLECCLDSINEIDLYVNGQTLTIKRDDGTGSKVKEEYYVRTERYNGWFNVVVPLPKEDIKPIICISCVNGFLELVASKIKKEPQ